MKPKLYLLVPMIIFLVMGIAIPQEEKGTVNVIYDGTLVTGNIPKIALLIGNAKYTHIQPLGSPEMDVYAVRDSLEALGVTVFLYVNCTLEQMKKALKDFSDMLSSDCWAIFYYSGHAVEYSDNLDQGATNYLLPVEIKSDLLDYEYKEKAFSADWVTEKLTMKTNGPKVIILDACRKNPFKSGMGSGLKAMPTQGNMLIAFAASPGNVASDGGAGQLSPYTAKLVKHLNTSGKTINEVLFTVQKEVIQASKNKQKPWITNGLEDDYYLNITPTDPNKATLIVTAPEAGKLAVGTVISENIAVGTYTFKIPKSSYTLKFTGATSGATYTEALDLKGGSVVSVAIPEANKAEPDVNLNPALPKMISVEGGTYRMGCTKSTTIYPCQDNETPHFVTVSSFKMSETEITNQQYCAFLNAKMDKIDEFDKWIDIDREYCKIKFFQGKFKAEPGFENYPVVAVSWYGADAYCKWAGGRLPSEAEWEYAARGGNKATSDYLFAGSDDPNLAGWHDGNSRGSVHPVKDRKKPNDLGLYDMSGNVWEWCSDWYGADYYKSSPANNPQGPSSGDYSNRVLRGGSWNYLPRNCRVTYRFNRHPDHRNRNNGFRLAFSH